MAYPKKKTFPRLGRGRFKTGPTGKSIFTNEYKGLTFDQQTEKAALSASDNGRCWWIYKFLKTPVYSWKVKPRADNRMNDWIHFN